MTRALATAACAAFAVLLVGATAGQAKAPDLIAHHKWLKTECVPAAGNTARAKVTVRMTVVNHDGFGGDWARRMRAEARLIPTTPGHTPGARYPWKKQKTGNLTINRTHKYTMTVLTDNVSPNLIWKVQLKLVWDRVNQSDVVKQATKSFNASCAGVIEFGS